MAAAILDLTLNNLLLCDWQKIFATTRARCRGTEFPVELISITVLT